MLSDETDAFRSNGRMEFLGMIVPDTERPTSYYCGKWLLSAGPNRDRWKDLKFRAGFGATVLKDYRLELLSTGYDRSVRSVEGKVRLPLT